MLRFPVLVNYDDGLGFLSFLIIPVYTIIVLLVWLLATKGQVKNKWIYIVTIGTIALLLFSLLNLFSVINLLSKITYHIMAFPAIVIVAQEILSMAIFLVWIVFYSKCLRNDAD